jgi:hypothetical protein
MDEIDADTLSYMERRLSSDVRAKFSQMQQAKLQQTLNGSAQLHFIYTTSKCKWETSMAQHDHDPVRHLRSCQHNPGHPDQEECRRRRHEEEAQPHCQQADLEEAPGHLSGCHIVRDIHYRQCRTIRSCIRLPLQHKSRAIHRAGLSSSTSWAWERLTDAERVYPTTDDCAIINTVMEELRDSSTSTEDSVTAASIAP